MIARDGVELDRLPQLRNRVGMLQENRLRSEYQKLIDMGNLGGSTNRVQ
jgi:hypothetical protein